MMYATTSACGAGGVRHVRGEGRQQKGELGLAGSAAADRRTRDALMAVNEDTAASSERIVDECERVVQHGRQLFSWRVVKVQRQVSEAAARRMIVRARRARRVEDVRDPVLT